ncbi:MAG: GMC family oxidoreductase [Gemmatimonadetes bacterium]|nr:GMC family oxidoreductase [Gemmatimonadota bacterium]
MRRVVESDICIIGSGITAALLAEKIAAEREASIVVIEAGDETLAPQDRHAARQRFLDYGENPWPHDHIDGLTADGIQSRSMQVGGLAMHWGGVTPRFSPEDFRVRSLYGVGDDWPITYEDLDPFYQEAEERMGVAGEQGPRDLDPREQPYPLPMLPLSYNLNLLKDWGAKADIPFWSQPSAKNSTRYGGRPACCRNDTCSPICPIGAKYSPDFTWRALRAAGRVRLITRTLVRRLIIEAKSDRIDHAIAVDRDNPDSPVEFHAKTFVLAGGYVWSPHLLLLSTSSRFPTGIANRSGLVGKYMTGHRNVSAFVSLPMKLYPGINSSHSLVSKKFMRPGHLDRYIRHDLRIWESTVGSEPRLQDDDGDILLGDGILRDWRNRTQRGTARVRAYYDVLPARESELTLDRSRNNPWGDPMPHLSFRDSVDSQDLRDHTEESIRSVFRAMAGAAPGEILSMRSSDFQDHPAGGCRMGDDPATSVGDGYGRTHDHENLFVVGAPTCVTGGCANGTLTFVALGLRSASRVGEDFPRRVVDGKSPGVGKLQSEMGP